MTKDLPRVSDILKGAGLIDMSRVRTDILKAALHFGSAVHKACELDDLGTLDRDNLSPPLLPYLNAWRKFREDYDLKFARKEIEIRLQSDKWGFRGTPDRIAKAKGLLCDIKSSVSMMPSVAIQLMAYQILAEENGVRIKKRLGVQLKEDGYVVTPYSDISDKSMFLSCLNLYNWKKRHGLLDKAK